MSRLHWTHRFGTLASTVAVIAVALAAYGSGILSGFDRLVYDLQTRWSAGGPPPDDILLVLLDADSAERLNRRRGGWSRVHLTAALENLCRARAAAVGVDMVLAAPDADPMVDARLARTIENCGNVVLARVAASGGRAVAPLAPLLAAAAGDGFIDLPPDTDNVLRRVPFFHALPAGDAGVELMPSFSLELARVYRGLSFSPDFSDPRVLMLGEDPARRLTLPYPDLLIRFKGDYRRFDHVSMAAVVAGDVPTSRIRGKLVIIGSHLAIEKDYFSTPYSRFNRVAPEVAGKFDNVLGGVLSDKDLGVSCQAQAAATILDGTAVREAAARWVYLLATAVGLAGSVFYLPVVGAVAGTAILLVLLTAALGSGVLAFQVAGVWLDTSPAALGALLQFITGTAFQKTIQYRKVRWISDLFGRYVSPDVAVELLERDMAETLAGADRDVTLLFADIRGFTAHSERLGPEATRALLDRYFNAMIPPVFAHRGTLDKLMGDAVMAIFGAPLPLPDHPERAADCALQMVAAMAALRSDAEPLRIGIGLNAGSAIVGNMGTDAFMDYTAIGDTVNLASRLEGLNKYYDTRIILSRDTARRLSDRFVVRRLDRVRVAGRQAPVEVCELIGYRKDSPGERLHGIQCYESVLSAYLDGDLETALKRLPALQAAMPDDAPTRLLGEALRRARAGLTAPREPVTDFCVK